jgi:hypothetical protein
VLLEKLPIGIQAFETLRGQGYLYVDKIRWVHRMVMQGMSYFLARSPCSWQRLSAGSSAVG